MARKKIQRVLVLQSAGQSGAFECGIFKALVRKNIHIDVVAGTSTGGINAALIAGSKTNHPEESLQQFWKERAKNVLSLSDKFRDWLSSQVVLHWDRPYVDASSICSFPSLYSGVATGKGKGNAPYIRWTSSYQRNRPIYFSQLEESNIYDFSSFTEILDKYIDYAKLQPYGGSGIRLILTAADVLRGHELIFDSFKQQITTRHLLATSGYPSHSSRRPTEVEKGIFALDGSILGRSPLIAVIDALSGESPDDLDVYSVTSYPRTIKSVPVGSREVAQRTRDIMFAQKIMHDIATSKVVMRLDSAIELLYSIAVRNAPNKELQRVKQIVSKLKVKGPTIRRLILIERSEQIIDHADPKFTEESIDNLIHEGESAAEKALKALEGS